MNGDLTITDELSRTIMDLPDLVVRYARAIGISSAPMLDAWWTPRENQDPTIAAMLGIDVEVLAALRLQFATERKETATRLLAEHDFADAVRRLPFAAGDRVLVVGDSITADALSWANLLAAVWQRAGTDIHVVNRALAGRTTAETLPSLPLAAAVRPTHALVMLGTNDTRRLGSAVGAQMASIAETERNLRSIRQLITDVLGCPRVRLLTPPPVDADLVAQRRAAGEWNEPDDLRAVAEVITNLDADAVDLHQVWQQQTRRPDDFFDADGLHPSPAGQIALLRAVVGALAE